MKFSFAALVALLASVAYSQTIASEVSQLPSCALNCLTTAISGAGCGLSDYACQCGTAESSITTAATPCVIKACAISDALKVQSITTEICKIQAASGGSSASSSVASSGQTPTTTYAATFPTGSFVSGIGSPTTESTSSAAGATTYTTVTTSASTSAPAQVSGSPGNRLQAGGIVVGAGALLALVL